MCNRTWTRTVEIPDVSGQCDRVALACSTVGASVNERGVAIISHPTPTLLQLSSYCRRLPCHVTTQQPLSCTRRLVASLLFRSSSSTMSVPTSTTTTTVTNNSTLTDECCAPGSAATYPSHLNFPGGREVKIGDIDCYSVNESNKNVVIFSTDVFGYRYANNQQNANQIAAGGFHVIIPDMFAGGAATPEELDAKGYGWLFSEWFPKNEAKKCAQTLVSVANALKKEGKVDSIQAVGYCYGIHLLPHGTLLPTVSLHPLVLISSSSLIFSVSRVSAAGCIGVLELYKKKIATGGVCAHPTGFNKDNISDCNVPTLFLCAENDQAFTPEIRQVWEQTLKEKQVPAKFVDYPGTAHGFSVRDDGSAIGVAARQAALQETVAFLKQGVAM